MCVSAEENQDRSRAGHERISNRSECHRSFPLEVVTVEAEARTRSAGKGVKAVAAASPARAKEEAVDPGIAGALKIPPPIRRAFDILQGEIDQAAEQFVANHSPINAELDSLQTQATQLICACVQATIDYVDAYGGAAAISSRRAI
jgi:hypothetical protein